MSLTLLFDETKGTVGIVHWFQDAQFNIAYPDGPLVEFPIEEFKNKCGDFVRKHFAEYKVRRVVESKCIPPLDEASLSKYLRRKLPVSVAWNYATDEISFWPLKFKSYSLGNVEIGDRDAVTKLPAGYTDSKVAEAIERALSAIR